MPSKKEGQDLLESRGGTPLYKPHRYVPSQRVRFLGLFGLKTGMHFAHFGLQECMKVFTSAEREVKDWRRSGMYQSSHFLTRLGKQSL